MSSRYILPISLNLFNQNFKVDDLGKAWVTDITYVWTSQGWLYLATVMDLFSRRIIGLATAMVMLVLNHFTALSKKEWIFHEKYRTRAQAQASILDYILHFYNCKRIHGTIG